MPESPPPLPPASPSRATTQAAGQTVDAGRGRIFPCERCGADLTFHIGEQALQCPYCGHVKPVDVPATDILEQDFHAMLARMAELHEQGRAGASSGLNEVRCEGCGATVEFAGSLTSSECPYCTTPLQRADVHTAAHRITTDALLPFLVEERIARQKLAEWVRSRWFAPNEFLRKGVEGRFSGSYLPYWTFDSLTVNRYVGERGEYYYVTIGSGKNRRRERRTRWYPASGDFQRFFDDVLTLASRGLSREMMQELEPWPLDRCVPFNQEMLAGFLARTYEIELDDGFQDAKRRIDEAIEDDVRSRIGGDTQRIHDIRTHYGAITFKHLLLPVWLLAYKYHATVYQTMINATTGEVQGDRPYSWVKITLAVICGLIVAGILALIFSQR